MEKNPEQIKYQINSQIVRAHSFAMQNKATNLGLGFLGVPPVDCPNPLLKQLKSLQLITAS